MNIQIIGGEMNFKLTNTSLVIFTDIDGTFLDHDTFSDGDNFEMLNKLVKCNHHVVFNSSKTFREIKKMQDCHKTSFPFICETGGGIYHKDQILESSPRQREGYNIMYESEKVETFESDVRAEISRNFRQDLDIFDFELSEEEMISYLANKGLKTSNIPLVNENSLPEALKKNPKMACVVGLSTEPERLADLRKNRMNSLKETENTNYTDLENIKKEVLEAKKTFQKYKWPLIDVTRKSVEETAASIIKIHEIYLNNAK